MRAHVTIQLNVVARGSEQKVNKANFDRSVGVCFAARASNFDKFVLDIT